VAAVAQALGLAYEVTHDAAEGLARRPRAMHQGDVQLPGGHRSENVTEPPRVTGVTQDRHISDTTWSRTSRADPPLLGAWQGRLGRREGRERDNGARIGLSHSK
jgi:hypothetical protein